jgi:class 3 adenylate cyclase/tetratricopeptide (TPR) repeat protein
MSLHDSSGDKPFKNFFTSLLEAYPDASMRDIAVLFTDVVGSTQYFKTHGDIRGREMLRKHHAIAIAIVKEYGGSLIKEVGDSVMVYFPDAHNALRASIKMQHRFTAYNQEAGTKNEIRIRIGLHFGKVIIEEKDIYGDVVNVAAKLTNLASGDQIFVSREIYELTKMLPSIHFELINFWNMKNVPSGLEIYKVIWETAPVSEPDKSATLYLHAARNPGQNNSQKSPLGTLESFIPIKDSFLENKHESEQILPDKTIILTYKDSLTAFKIAERILEHLTRAIKKTSPEEKPPVYLIISGDLYSKERSLPIDASSMHPGNIYLTKNIYEDINKKKAISIHPLPEKHPDQPFYQYVNEVSGQSARQQAPYMKSNYNGGALGPCFYCNERNHYPKDCPSKALTETSRAVNDMGYLSLDTINRHIADYEVFKNNSEKNGNDGHNEYELAINCLYELKGIYQLRFFRTIWGSHSEEWAKAKKNKSESEGGFVWLSLDSFRVSNHERAEAYLKTAFENNPKDYKSHCIAGFLNIEKDNLAAAMTNFNTALTFAGKTPQKMYIHFLQSRVYVLIGNIQKAQETIRKILALDSDCAEAIYQDIIFKLQQKKDKSYLQKLVKLIKENKHYYVITLVDPDMAPYRDLINEELTKIIQEARVFAIQSTEDTRTTLNNTQISLTRETAEEIQSIMTKIEELIKSASYFGYLDIPTLGHNVTTICSTALKEQKQNLAEFIYRQNKRLEIGLNFIRSYRFPQLSAATLKKLKLLKSKITDVGNTSQFFTSWQFDVCRKQCSEIAQELDHLEPVLRRLSLLQHVIGMLLSFLKHSSMLFAVIFFLGIFVFPYFSSHTNDILMKLDISSSMDQSSLQKTFLLLGGFISIIVSFFLSIKNALKEESYSSK